MPAEKLAHVPNPIGLRLEAIPTQDEARQILTVGRLDKQKGHDVLLQAFAQSQARRAGWRLAIVGDGALAGALREQAAALELGEAVEWHGLLADPSACYADSGIFVLASRYEGTPNVVLEALSAGLPVIVTEACGGALAFIEHERSGLVVPTEDPRALADAIDRLASEPDLRRALGRAGHGRLGDYSPERALARWEAVLSRPEETSAQAFGDLVRDGRR